MTRHHVNTAGLLVAGTVLLAVFAVGVDGHLGTATGQQAPAPAAGPALATAGLGDLDASIDGLTRRLERVPGDWQARARLGLAHVEQARITADPTHYERAEQHLRDSLDQHPDGNDVAAAGMGALANARHDFAAAATWGQRALETNPHSATALGVLTDARVQLGQYDRATQVVQRMLDLRPTYPPSPAPPTTWSCRAASTTPPR